MLLCFNKILKDLRPAEKVVSPDELIWLKGKVKNSPAHKYEDEFHIFYFSEKK